MSTTRPLTSPEISSLLSVLPSLPLRDQVLLLAGLRTGFRVSELLQIRIADVWLGGGVRPSLTLQRRHLKFGRSARCASIRSRTVPLGQSLKQVLECYVPTLLARGSRPVDTLFPSRKWGTPLQRCHVGRILRHAFSLAGIAPGGWGMHSLRKSFCVGIHAMTKDLNLTRLAMGHGSVAVTQRYLESSSPATAEAILALG